MRGKVFERPGGFVEIRITPAYAGKRSKSMTLRSLRGDHPRVCGEKRSRRHHLVAEQGSPPRMRGKVLFRSFIVQPFGITPAYAGKRSAASRPAAAARDHPRVCGEKQALLCTWMFLQGSPPRMRGKESHARRKRQAHGITPACAGKSQYPVLRNLLPWDHPRMCGEKLSCLLLQWCFLGSPPRMRGKVFCSVRRNAAVRITPTYAGKRLKRSRSTVPHVAIVPLFPSVCNKPVVSDGSPAGRDAPLFLPAENAVPASPAYNLRSL